MLEEIKIEVHCDGESLWSVGRLERALGSLGFRFLREPSRFPDTITVRMSFDPLRLHALRTRNAGREKVGTALTKEVYEEYRLRGFSDRQMMKELGISQKTFYRRKAEFSENGTGECP